MAQRRSFLVSFKCQLAMLPRKVSLCTYSRYLLLQESIIGAGGSSRRFFGASCAINQMGIQQGNRGFGFCITRPIHLPCKVQILENSSRIYPIGRIGLNATE